MVVCLYVLACDELAKLGLAPAPSNPAKNKRLQIMDGWMDGSNFICFIIGLGEGNI